MAEQFFSNTSSAFKDYDIIQEQVDALKECVSDNAMNFQGVVKHLTKHVAASPTPVELQQRLAGLWTLLNEVAVVVPSSQPAVISVLRTIRTLPAITEPKGEGEGAFDFDDGEIWKELTGWANNWADNYNSYAAGVLNAHEADESKRKQRYALWKNACSYTARLDATGDDYLSSCGAGLERATHAISYGLEVRDVDANRVEPAAQLFILAARGLWNRCKTGKREGMLDVAGIQIWRGEPGFSEARWAFWKEQWGSVDEDPPFAKEALLAMQLAESESTTDRE